MSLIDSMAVPLPDEVTRLDLSECNRIAFLSDVHLEVSLHATYLAWSAHLKSLQSDALFILGDLFDVWLGDDYLEHPTADFERQCLSDIRAVSDRMPVYWMVGNRDFLLDNSACNSAGMQAVSDPCVVMTPQENWLLTHGDALCLDDTTYQAYRREIRSSEWITRLKNTSLSERMVLAKELKAQSQLSKSQTTLWADVDHPAALQWMDATHTSVLIHGHTHRPQEHQLSASRQRIVLSDWEALATPPRLQTLQWIRGQGFSRQTLTAPDV